MFLNQGVLGSLSLFRAFAETLCRVRPLAHVGRVAATCRRKRGGLGFRGKGFGVLDLEYELRV